MTGSADAAAPLLLKARKCRDLALSARLPEVARSLLDLAREFEAEAGAPAPDDEGKAAAD